MRIGHGYDVHRYKDGRPCILCGVRIDVPFGPDGHSDADAPVHALIDAMLGALAMGDIGKLFPDDDERYRDADSIELLKITYEKIRAKGYFLSNADITIIAQKPKLMMYTEKMRETIAAALCTDCENISIKATTEEKMGFTGEGKGLAAHAVVLMDKIKTE